MKHVTIVDNETQVFTDKEITNGGMGARMNPVVWNWNWS